MEYPGAVGPSNKLQSVLADCQRTMNLYFEAAPGGRPALYSMPGRRSYIGMAGGIVDVGGRALFEMNDRAFGVVGGGVYELFATQTATKYGTVAQDNNPAFITMNGISGNQAAFASGGNLYVLNLATNVLSSALLTGEVTQIGMLDGYGIWFNKTLGKIRLSNLNDFATNDPTQFALRSSAPDDWEAMLVNAPDVWLIGGQSGDVWYDAGNFPFPLAPRPGASFPYGIAATFSLASAGDSVLWLSKNANGDGIVVRARGYVPQPISSPALETAISEYRRTATITDAEAMVFQIEGHTFYVLRFPAANATWAYDLNTNLWTECGRWNSTAGRYDVWEPRVHCLAFGKHLVGDLSTGTIAEMDVTFGTEVNGDPVRYRRVFPSLVTDGYGRLSVDRLTIHVEMGLGTVVGAGSDPKMMLRISRDFGKTWGNERQVSLGRLGKFGQRAFFTRCGTSLNSFTPELVIAEPTPVRIVGADVEGSGFARGRAA